MKQGSLLSISEAAEYLGYTAKGLRRIVDRSRAAASGSRTSGPTIKFFQAGKNAPIKFRQSWLDEFIEANTVDPSAARPQAAKPPKRKHIPGLLDGIPSHGLDPALLG